MLYKSTLWYTIYTGRKINWETFNQYFKMNGDDKTWYIYYIEYADGQPWFELHAHIDGDIVVEAEPFKADVYGGHGKPIINEKSLTSEEKKYAMEIFNQCFIDRVGDSLYSIIDEAIEDKVSFCGYTAIKKGLDYILFKSPEEKNVKLQNKNLLKALDYSHITLDILRQPEFAQNFAKCLGLKIYEPLYAILQNVDPSGYLEYVELERKYRYEKLKSAIENNDIEECQEYIDVLKNEHNDIEALCTDAIHIDSEEILRWIVENAENSICDLCPIMASAIKKDKENLFYYLLNSNMYDASKSDSTRWDSPVYAAAHDRGREKYVMPLLEHGFSMSERAAYPLYSICTLDEIARFIPYNVTFDSNTITRIYTENREDIIKEIEKQPLRYCSSNMLLEAYINCGDFDKFSNLLCNNYVHDKTGFFDVKLFEKAYSRSIKWTDLWIENGFDVNGDNAILLHNACDSLDVDMVIYLIENGANPRLRGKYSQTVFERAAGFHGGIDSELWPQKEKICKYLLSKGLNPIEESLRKPSILFYLIGKSEEFDIFLIDWLADNNCINDLCEVVSYTFGKEVIRELPISYVLNRFFPKKYNPKVLRYFIEKGARFDINGTTDKGIFLSAVELCDLEELKSVVSAGANVNVKDYDGTNALLCAVKCNRPIEVIKYLISLGLDVNNQEPGQKDRYGSTTSFPAMSVLDFAEKNGDCEIIEYLEKCGALRANELANDKD